MSSRLLLLPLLFLAAPLAAQNSLPQPAPLPDTVPAPRDVAYPGTMILDVDATDATRGILHARQTIPVAQAGPMTLLFPQWLPGKHAPRGEIEKLAGLKISAKGETIAWTRDPLDVYAFHIQVPEGARQIDIALDFLSATQGDQGRVAVTPAMMNLAFETVSLYPAGYFARRIPVRATVTYPAGWKAASGLPSRASGSTYAYETTDYETLVDSPVFAGRYFRQETLSDRVRLNIVADHPGDLAATPAQIGAHRKLVEQSIRLFGSQPYDRYEFLLALTDEMGGIGIEHHRSSENGANPEYFTGWASGPGSRGLLPHEFTHAWNGKYKRPAGNWTPDFNTPMNNTLLWVYEGQTQFWGMVLAARSGLVSKQDTLDAIATMAAALDLRRGRDWRPLQDTTNDPVITARRPKGWVSQQRSEDYYAEGMLVWLEADAILRAGTGGAKGLDDFARAFFQGRDGDWGTSTYVFGDVVLALNAVMPYDWLGLLTTRLSETARGAPLAGLTKGGYRLAFGETPSASLIDGERRAKSTDLSYSLGMSIGKDGKLSQVIWGGPAFAQGLTVGSEIVAVAGRSYSDEAIKAAVTAAKGGKEPVRLLVKNGDRFREIAIDYHEGLRYPRLEKTSPGEGSLDRLLVPKP